MRGANVKHLVRAGGVLLFILAATFIAPKLVPQTVAVELEPYGFYAGQDDSENWADLPVKFADPASCITCHTEISNTWQKAAHKSVSCENCHGPANDHITKAANVTIDTSRELCSSCHATVIGRPVEFPQIDINSHGGQSQCITCHIPHSPALK